MNMTKFQFRKICEDDMNGFLPKCKIDQCLPFEKWLLHYYFMCTVTGFYMTCNESLVILKDFSMVVSLMLLYYCAARLRALDVPGGENMQLIILVYAV